MSGTPLVSDTVATEASPNTWNSGSAVPERSSGPMPEICRPTSATASRLPTVIIAPLGLPVVPEV